MTMGDGNHLISLASGTLGTPADAALETRRTNFLNRLDEDDYMPSPDVLEAAGVFGIVSREGDVFPVLESRFEQFFTERLGQFAGEYWDLEPEDRREEWVTLDRLSETLPKHHFRMTDLRASLDLEIPADPDEMFIPVIRALETAYVLSKAARKVRLDEIRDEEGLQASEFRLLVNSFLGKHREFEQVFATLGVLKIAKPAVLPGETRDVARRKAKGHKSLASAEGQKKGLSVPGIVMIIVLGLGGGLMKAGCKSNSSPSSVNYQFKPISPPTMPRFEPFKMPAIEYPKIRPYEFPKTKPFDPFENKVPVVPKPDFKNQFPDLNPKTNQPRP